MAALTYGVAKLRAVNRLLRAIGALPVSAVDSSGTFPTATYGTSQAARAEELLDDMTPQILSRGWEENTARGVSLALDGASPNTITVNVNTLRVIPVGKDAHRSIGITASTSGLYDMNADSSSFTAAITADRVFYKAFTDCTPALQELITDEAAVVFQRRYRASPDQDAWLSHEQQRVEVVPRKPGPQPPGAPVNPVMPTAPVQLGERPQ